MPTIGEVYNPLVEAAINNDPNGLVLLIEVAVKVLEANPDRLKSMEEGIAAVKNNLDYYCQYFGEETENKVKEFYGLGVGFRDLLGRKHSFS